MFGAKFGLYLFDFLELLHDLLMLVQTVPVPTVSFAVEVHAEIRLQVLVRGNVAVCEPSTRLARSL